MRNSIKNIALLLVLAAFSACGGAQVMTNPIEPGEPPEGMDFDGVWFSNWGRLELTRNGDEVQGIYEGDRKKGRIDGEIDGDLLRYSWTEWELSLRGKPRETSGHGVFQYAITDVGGNIRHEIKGTWGYGDSDMGGGKWEAAKSKKAKKKLKPFDPDAAVEQFEQDKASSGFVEDEEDEYDDDEDDYDDYEDDYEDEEEDDFDL